MPQNKNLTQISLSEGGFGKENGVINAGKKALTREASKRYQQAGKKERTGILDKLVKTTGYNRKYLLRISANRGKPQWPICPGKQPSSRLAQASGKKEGAGSPIYADEFTAVLRKIRVFFRYRCGKIPAPFLRKRMKYLVKPFNTAKEARELPLKADPADHRSEAQGGQEKARI